MSNTPKVPVKLNIEEMGMGMGMGMEMEMEMGMEMEMEMEKELKKVQKLLKDGRLMEYRIKLYMLNLKELGL